MKVLRTFARIDRGDPNAWMGRMDGLLLADPTELAEFVGDALIGDALIGSVDHGRELLERMDAERSA